MTADWTFTDMGTEFDAHVAAHLPGYADVQRLVALVATFAVPDAGVVADLGCSTGRSSYEIARLSRNAEFWLYDSDDSMLAVSAERPFLRHAHRILGDVEYSMQHAGADLTLALWLLQFMHPRKWRPILSEARLRASPNGCVLVAAKTQHPDPRWEQIAVAALDDYKSDQGVRPPERADKTKALRGVLHPVPPAQIARDLVASGWHSPTVLWKWHVWSIIGAWASPLAPDEF